MSAETRPSTFEEWLVDEFPSRMYGNVPERDERCMRDAWDAGVASQQQRIASLTEAKDAALALLADELSSVGGKLVVCEEVLS